MGTSSGENYFDVKVSIVVSLLAWPISYFVETGITKVDEEKRTLVLMSVGFVLLATIIFVVSTFATMKNWMRYVFTLFAFTSVIDLIISLEFKGYISGFMSEYLEIGEPYLCSPWGSAIALFDGLFLYTMYLILIHLISNGKSWRSMGIYWVSAIFNSMIVLLFGVATGKHTPTFCTILNVPYALVPIFIGIRLFSKEKAQGWSTERIKSNGFLFDLTVLAGLVCAIWIVFVKGMLSLGSQFKIFQDVLSHERALLDIEPAPFAIIQSITYLFYVLPILFISLVYVFSKKKPQFVWDLALINGGLLFQGQFSFIVTALDTKTSAELRSDPLDWVFWINNLTLLVVPQVFLWSLYKSNVKNNTERRKIN